MRQPSPLFNTNVRATDGFIRIISCCVPSEQMDPEAKSMFFILSQEVKWKLPVTYNSLTDIYMKSVCPDLYFTENDDGEVDSALT